MQQDNISSVAEGMNHSGVSSNTSNLPLRAVLLDSAGIMRELWLPAMKEGKYCFVGVEDLVSIIADGDQWVAVCGGSGFFQVNGDNRPNRVVLRDKGLVKAAIGNRAFSIYVEADHGNNNIFLPYTVERYTEITIGRSPSCDLYCASPYVSRPHASLYWDGKVWTVTDLGSTNSTFVNGKKVGQPTIVGLGDVIYIMGIYIVIGAGYISINNADDRVTLMTPRVRLIQCPNDIVFSRAKGSAGKEFFDRKPRKKYKLNVDPIEIDMPPAPMNANKIPLALRLGNSAVMGGRSILMGNYISALTSMVFPALTQGYSEKDRKEYEEKRKIRYREYLKEKETEIEKEIEYEEQFLNEIFPNLTQMLRFSEDQDRLWERRKIDDDFLTVRLGRGDRPMVAEKQYSPKRFEMEPDFLLDEMYQLAEKPSVLRNVPITLSLRDDWTIGITGEHTKAVHLVRNMIMALAVTHAYDEAKLVLFVDSQDAGVFGFAKYLRHFWDNDRNNRFFADNPADAQTVAKYLGDHWHSMMEDNGNRDIKAALKKQPAYIAFFLSKDLYDRAEFFKELLSQDNYTGISVVAAFENAPKECSKLIDLRGEDTLIDLANPDIEDQVFYMDVVSQEIVDISMRQLTRACLRLDSESYSLPSLVTFLEMYGVGRVEHLNPMARWAENNPVSSLAVPIGVGTDGRLFTLDLHEKRQGPHGLVAGMTGSGKSEFIITYILSMAVNFSPDEVAFILIDYKGGGLADAFVDPKRGIHLPHVVATITNLDGAAINRSLVSIHSELKRRQAVFKQAKSDTNEGTMDIYDYQKLYRNKRVKEPMPHLFIISDEFAELKKQQPEFMDELISTARIGRSLGVHLILATQKPGGVVNDQIWSNTKFRACLRVQDRSDSMEMLKRPEAAELRNTGRFYLQVGYNEFFALGQSAWCGAGYYPRDEVVVEKDKVVEFVDSTGQTILKATPKTTAQKADCKQIVAIVQYLSDLAKREGIQPKSLWLDPLPKKLELSDMLANSLEKSVDHIMSLIGKVDDPEVQDQYALTLDMQSFHNMLLCGQSGSGKSTFIRTMLFTLLKRYTPEELNYYILDLSSGALNAFRTLPHCGAYITEENESDFDRMLSLIKDLIDERKKLFADADVFGYDAYVKNRKLPLILVILDGWTNINTFRKGQEYSLTISANMREASNYGIRFILTVNHINEVSGKAKQELDYRIALRAKDKFDYNDILEIRGATLPPEAPGRGVCVIEGRPLEYHVAVLNCQEDDQTQNALLKNELSIIAERDGAATQARKLPMMDSNQEYSDFSSSFMQYRIPLGYSMDTLKPIAIPFQQLYSTGIFLGNPIGIKPVFSNLITEFLREDADVIIVRRVNDTVFNMKLSSQLAGLFGSRCRVLDTSVDNLELLFELIMGNMQDKKPYRDEYCVANDIPESDKGRTKKAAKYVRERSKPLFVLFESFADLIHSEISKDLREEFAGLFSLIKGYNIYFIGCFYPDDDSAPNDLMFRSLLKDDFALLFGGCFNKQWITSIPSDYKKMERVNPNYNRFLLKYHTVCYKMVMPCGELISDTGDPDENELF